MEINTKYSIIKKIRNLDKNVKQVILLSLVVVLLFVGTTILKNITNKKTFTWNYKKIESAKTVLTYGKINKDRYLYWDLKDIVYNYLYTQQDLVIDEVNSNESRVDYMDYYDLLTEKYKKYLDKKKYDIVATEFISNFLEQDHLGYKYVANFVIQKIYEYDNNMYLCVLDNDDLAENKYIGIKLDKNKPKFSIFYIE